MPHYSYNVLKSYKGPLISHKDPSRPIKAREGPTDTAQRSIKTEQKPAETGEGSSETG
jgi:hypothetical protein